MSNLLHLLVQLPLLWLAVMLASSLVAALCYPLFRRFNQGYSPDTRAFALLAYGLMAPVTAALMVTLAMHPELGAGLVPQHCHGGSCEPHRPNIATTSLPGMALISLSTLVMLVFAAVVQRKLMRNRRRTRALKLLSRANRHSPYRVVENPGLLAWCAGLWRPQVYLSTGLLNALRPDEIRAVVAHEYSHAARRDNLRALILRLTTAAWPAAIKKQLWSDFTASTEEACDLLAAREMESPSPVIGALTRLKEKYGEPLNATPADFIARDPQGRIQALRSVKEKKVPLGGWLAIALPAVISIGLFTGITHRTLELLTVPGMH